MIGEIAIVGVTFASVATTLAAMQANAQIVLRYCTPEGKSTPDANPNGSVDNIAGVCNPARNVAGLMPHPENAVEAMIGGTDGVALFKGVAELFA